MQENKLECCPEENCVAVTVLCFYFPPADGAVDQLIFSGYNDLRQKLFEVGKKCNFQHNLINTDQVI